MSKLGSSCVGLPLKQIIKIFMLFFTASTFSVLADLSELQKVKTDQWYISAAVGYGYQQSPRIKSDGTHAYILPSIAYYSDKFYLENTTLGYSLYESEKLIIDIQSKLNEDAFHFKIDGLKHVLMSDIFGYAPINNIGFEDASPRYTNITRKISYLAGIYIAVPMRFTNFSIGAYQDISNVHNGHEVQAKLNHTFNFEHFAVAYEIGITYKSNELLNYYYALTPQDRQYFESTYKDDERISGHIRLITKVPLNTRWSVVAIAEYNYLAKAIQRSQLIVEKDYLGYFFGFSYDF